MTKTFYLATPYSKQRTHAQAYLDALAAQVRLLNVGLDVFCPVVYFHPASIRMRERPHSFWMARCMPFLMAADELLVVKMPGWENSEGIAEEMRLFKGLSKPIVHLGWPMTDLDVAMVLARESASDDLTLESHFSL